MNNRTKFGFLDVLSGIAPYLIIGVTFLVTISALVSLILSDIITGQVTGEHISTNPWFGLFVSLATTGMLIGCGSMLVSFINKNDKIAFTIVLLIFLGLQGADVYFDAISVDVMRFGKIISTSETLDKPEAMAHNVYRILVGGVSLVGEPLAIGSLVMLPALKKFFYGILRENTPNIPANSHPKPIFPNNFHPAQRKPPPQGLPRMKPNHEQTEFIPDRYEE